MAGSYPLRARAASRKSPIPIAMLTIKTSRKIILERNRLPEDAELSDEAKKEGVRPRGEKRGSTFTFRGWGGASPNTRKNLLKLARNESLSPKPSAEKLALSTEKEKLAVTVLDADNAELAEEPEPPAMLEKK